MTGLEESVFLGGLAALPLLLALYFWRRRSRPREVGALFLWDEPVNAARSGTRFAPHLPPASFLLEALIVLLLVLAAASPFLMRKSSYPPLALIVDVSSSMDAAPPGGKSPRRAGEEYAEKILKRVSPRRVIRIAAGVTPRLIADDSEAFPFDSFGKSSARASDLAGAVALARTLAKHAEILVVTDHAPEFPLSDNVSWFSGGKALGNTAIVNVRSTEEELLVESMNLSGEPRHVRLVPEPGTPGEFFTLAPGERRKSVIPLSPAMRAKGVSVLLECDGDPLPADNRAVLLPETRPPLTWRISSALPEKAKRDLRKVLSANPAFSAAPSNAPELVFSLPGKRRNADGKAHCLFWHIPEPGRAVVTSDPLSVLAGNELTRGLSVQDLRWSADPALMLPGRVLIRQGRSELLSIVSRADGKHELHLNLDPAKSNPARRPFWPVFFWNLASILRRERPGTEYANYRAGATVRVRASDPVPAQIRVTHPGGKTEMLPLVRRSAFFLPEEPGIYRIDAGEGARCGIAVTNLDADESDLRNAAPFRKSATRLPDAPGSPRLHLTFAFLLAALALLMLHQSLYGKGKRA